MAQRLKDLVLSLQQPGSLLWRGAIPGLETSICCCMGEKKKKLYRDTQNTHTLTEQAPDASKPFMSGDECESGLGSGGGLIVQCWHRVPSGTSSMLAWPLRVTVELSPLPLDGEFKVSCPEIRM